MDNDSIPGLEPEKVARLVGLTLSHKQGERRDKDAAIKKLLQDRLADTLEVDDGKRQGLPQAIGRLLRPRRLVTQQSLGSVLLDPGSTLGAIRKIRRYAKDGAARTDDEAEYTVMTTIYFAAIANRLAFHGQRITTYSYESLVSSFGKLGAKVWMPAELGALFERAEKLCREKAQDNRAARKP